ncbi:MAG: Tyrosine-protein kinase YwqD [Chloroflexi bacterium ADurb.Bin325]|nr:MAG: Tyrosine-protein kinase YwqD [Chloroflexi bacterium ADurb.Bin325]
MELKEYFGPLRKWWWLVVAATVIATLSSYLATRQQPFDYAAKVTLLVGRSIQSTNPQDYEINASQQLGQTYASLASTQPIRKGAMAALGLTWLPDYTAAMVGNTQLLTIRVIDTDPLRAQAVANEIANQLILQTPTEDRDLQQRREYINRELAEIEQAMDATKAEIARLREDLAGMFSARQIADTQNKIAGLEQKLTSYRNTYLTSLNLVQGGVNTLQIVEPAELPTAPVGPNKGMTILLAAAIGFLLAAGAAYGLEYLDDTIKHPDDIHKTFDLTTLGAVPAIKPTTDGDMFVFSAEGQSAAVEAYRVLRTNLQFAAVGRPLRALMITSPAPSEGKTLTASNLAAALAQAGKRVILVDADLHRPRLHRLFKLRNNIGLTSALLEDAPDLDALLQPAALPGLSVLTSGPLPPNPAELLGAAAMHKLAERLKARADMVIFDTPPVMVLADAAVLGSQVDGVLMVFTAGATRREMARQAIAALQQVNARIVGALLNRVPARAGGYYYYYYYDRYGSRYGDRHNHDGDGAGDAAGSRSNDRRSPVRLKERLRRHPAPARES